MLAQSGVIYQYNPHAFSGGDSCAVSPVVPVRTPDITEQINGNKTRSIRPGIVIGTALLLLSLTGIALPLYPRVFLATAYKTKRVTESVRETLNPPVRLPPALPVLFDPLKTSDGQSITPVNTDFSIVIPKIGVNSTVIPSVDPLNPEEYTKALKNGVAHAKTSYLPDQAGTVYLFSHSTNYEWFVRDLNAVFYLVKNLEPGDLIVVFYKGKRYTYEYTAQEVASPKDTTHLIPETGRKRLILQTCWPPGSVAERLLIFAELIEEDGKLL